MPQRYITLMKPCAVCSREERAHVKLEHADEDFICRFCLRAAGEMHKRQEADKPTGTVKVCKVLLPGADVRYVIVPGSSPIQHHSVYQLDTAEIELEDNAEHYRIRAKSKHVLNEGTPDFVVDKSILDLPIIQNLLATHEKQRAEIE